MCPFYLLHTHIYPFSGAGGHLKKNTVWKIHTVFCLLHSQYLSFLQDTLAVIALGTIFVARGSVLPEVGRNLGAVNDKGHKGRAETGLKEIQ